jgi:ABC-type transporter MlaC component
MAFPPAGRLSKAIRALALLAALTVAYFAGVLTERLRFDTQRNAVIQKYDKALKDYHEQQMRVEKASEKTSDQASR